MHVSLRRLLLLPVLTMIGACSGASLGAEQVFHSEHHAIRAVPVVTGLQHPWSLAFLPDGRMLVTERPGRLRLIDDNGLVETPITGLPDHLTASGQGGLLDVVLAPDFEQSRMIYFSFSGSSDGGLSTEVARARLDADALQLHDVEIVFRARPKTGGGRHFGSRLVFAGDGTLFVTLGDRGQRDRARDPGDHIGTLVRIAPDGGIPADNPFTDRADALPEVYTYGNRNMQGAALHPRTGELWTHEHGPRGGDEVNLMKPGADYGWPVLTHGTNYDGSTITTETSRPGMESPLHHWTPSIAPSGMAFYTGDRFPAWQGNLLVGALRSQLLSRLELDGERIVHEEQLLVREVGRIRDVRQGPDGYVYLLIDAPDAPLIRLEPT